MASRAEEKQRRREERQQAEAEAAAHEQRQRLVKLVTAAVLLAIIAVVVVIIVSQSGGSGGGSTNLKNVSKVNAQLNGIPQNGSVLGQPSAKATLVEFGDLQCSTCQFYALNVLPSVISNQVRSGQAKIDFRPVEVIGPQSVPAAAAAEAAGLQGRFWSYIEIFYNNQGAENSGYVTDSFMTAVAKAAGVPNIGKWNQDRKNPKWARQVQQDQTAFANFGFSGTPSFAIQRGNGPVKPIPGQAGTTTTLPPAAINAAIKNAQ